MSVPTHEHIVSVSIVVPVYAGEETLPGLIDEIAPLHNLSRTPAGRPFIVSEVVLVWDRGPGRSDECIRKLASQHDWIRPVWLSRNFGQHAATLAGMASTGGEWIATIDEDGQHDPAYIGAMLDRAYDTSSQLVYAAPTNAAPHGALRNAGSATAKWLFKKLVGDTDLESFHSYRLILGEVGRSAAAYTGSGVYLDVALAWVVSSATTCPVPMRAEGRPASNYSPGRLFSHFGRLVISSGTRPLALVSLVGLGFFVLGILYSIWILAHRIAGDAAPVGWTSTFVAILVIGGLTLFSLGVIAQYIRSATNMSLGKPLYVVVRDPSSVFTDDVRGEPADGGSMRTPGE